MFRDVLVVLCAGVLSSASTAQAQEENLVNNPGFLDLDGDEQFGDGWGSFGAASVEIDFFGDSNVGHATLFGDNTANIGGVFQTGIPAEPGATYEVIARIQWETLWDANTFFGVEYYAADDETRISVDIVEITDELVGSGYQRIGIVTTVPAGAAFIRPIFGFDSVVSDGASRAATVDNVIIREPSEILNLNPGFLDTAGDGQPGEFWGTFGAAATDLDFFNNGNPGHATLFADQNGNSGGVFQQGVVAAGGESYTLTADLSFESNYDADTFVGLEFFGADEAFLLGADEIEITENPGVGYLTFRVDTIAPSSPFLSFIRPIIRFENSVSTTGDSEAATVDNVKLRLTSDVGFPCIASDLAEPFAVIDFFDALEVIRRVESGALDAFELSPAIQALVNGCP